MPYRELPHQEPGSRTLVTVGRYSSTVDAELVRASLEANDVLAFVIEATSYNALPACVQVPARDEERARRVIGAMALSFRDEDDGEEDGVRCPRCELAYCSFGRARFADLVASASLGALLLRLIVPGKRRWRCHKCYHAWDDPNEGPRFAKRLHPDDPRPVFRLRRTRVGSGVLLGLMAGAMGAAALGNGALLLVAVPMGWAIGRLFCTDSCSEPSCRAKLASGVEECGQCRGVIAGTITAAHQHFPNAAAARRELAADRMREGHGSAPSDELSVDRKVTG